MPHKLLLADDSVTIQRVIELTFADEDVQVIAVGDGRQAIERVQSDPPDIVLADVGMPERDGYEVAAFIKGNPQLAHIPVLLLTGAFEPIDEGRAKAAACDGVLVKPFEPQIVIARVKDLLAGRRAPAAPAPVAAAPPPRTPIRVATGAATPAPAEAPKARGGGSLEDYFDRLDAAFASVGATPAGEAQEVGDVSAPPVPFRAPGGSAAPATERARTAEGELSSWDPDLSGDPGRPAAAGQTTARTAPEVSARPWMPDPQMPAGTTAAATATAAPAAPAAPAPVPAPADARPLPSLADAFAALLAAEQGYAVASSAPGSPAPEQTIETIVRRVLDRMTGETVKETVVHVAERLVREEIERIKGS
jgi:CheY-like chemotaxis protein